MNTPSQTHKIAHSRGVEQLIIGKATSDGAGVNLTDGVLVHASAPSRILIISGKPLKEPIVQYGPFVMNTQDEIYQALSDMRAGKLGESAVP